MSSRRRARKLSGQALNGRGGVMKVDRKVGFGLACAALIAGSAFLSNRAAVPTARGQDEAPPVPEEPNCSQTASLFRIEAAQKAGLISGLDGQHTSAFIVIVRPHLWSLLTLDRQKQIAESVDCAVAAPGYLKAVAVRAFLDGPDLMKLSSDEMVRLLRNGYSSLPARGPGAQRR